MKLLFFGHFFDITSGSEMHNVDGDEKLKRFTSQSRSVTSCNKIIVCSDVNSEQQFSTQSKSRWFKCDTLLLSPQVYNTISFIKNDLPFEMHTDNSLL